MRALTFQGIENIRCEQVPDPGLVAPDDVLIRVDHAAICGSDLHVYHGRERGLDPGAVMGHEFMGEIVEAGKQVRGFKKGDRVACPFTTNCGRCFFCLKGLTCRCQHGQLFGWVQGGHGLQGVQAEFVRVPLADGSLFRLPEDVPADEALLLGDIMATGYFAADMAGIKADGVYAVVGCGPVGLMAVIGAREHGAEKIYAIDAIPERLEAAQRFGAIPIDYQQTDPVAMLQDATEGRGADAVMEMVGSPAASRLALNLVSAGGTVSVAGVHNEPNFSFSPAEAYDKNLTLKVGRCPARFYMPRLLSLLQQKKYDVASIISHRFTLEQGPRGYDLFAKKRDGCTKVILTP